MDQNHNKYKGDMESVGNGEPIKSGKGEMIFYDGSHYNGQWLHNKRHGEGVYISQSKDRYEGSWYDD